MSDVPKDPRKHIRLDGSSAAKVSRFFDAPSKVKRLRELFGSTFAPGWSGGRTLDEVLALAEFETTTKEGVRKAIGTYFVLDPSTQLGLAERAASMVKPEVKISFGADLSDAQVSGALQALADYYRACGGAGLELESGESEEYPLA